MGRLIVFIQLIFLFPLQGETQSIGTSHNDTSLVTKGHNILKSEVLKLAQSGRLVEAAAVCEEFLNSYPGDSLVNYISGAVYFDLKKYERALVYFDRAKQGGLHVRDVYYLIGLCNYYLVHDQLAVDAFEKALDFGEDPQTIFLIGVCKNNLRPGTGCPQIKRAIDLGFPDQGGVYKSDCK